MKLKHNIQFFSIYPTVITLLFTNSNKSQYFVHSPSVRCDMYTSNNYRELMSIANKMQLIIVLLTIKHTHAMLWKDPSNSACSLFFLCKN